MSVGMSEIEAWRWLETRMYSLTNFPDKAEPVVCLMVFRPPVTVTGPSLLDCVLQVRAELRKRGMDESDPV